MSMFPLEEFAQAIARERELEAARLARLSAERPPLRFRLARLLALAAMRLDPRAGESALKASAQTGGRLPGAAGSR
ncbi:MAG: hypothetical protein HYS09_08335 [Chloroflexi bacterium]|nr:hypothetical protein [Chloroflexota bacterium]